MAQITALEEAGAQMAKAEPLTLLCVVKFG